MILAIVSSNVAKALNMFIAGNPFTKVNGN
jgi:hypothetical protein